MGEERICTRREKRNSDDGLPNVCLLRKLLLYFTKGLLNFKDMCIKNKCTGNFTTWNNNLMLIYFAQIIIININKVLIIKTIVFLLHPQKTFPSTCALILRVAFCS